MDKHLHIISYNVPYPVNQGGLYDVFYKLRALQEQGVRIHLHCFDYGRGAQEELKAYCESVQYYERHTGHKGISTSLPYVVASRKNESLINDLLQDDYPIFMEGIHSSYPVVDERFRDRKCFVRLHNVECDYYNSLYQSASSPLRKLYYKREAIMLKAYEKRIAAQAVCWGITEADTLVYRNQFHAFDVDFLPLFIPPHWQVSEKKGNGSYCLYHADLGIEANEKAAIWLLEKVFNELHLPLVIAGSNASSKLEEAAHSMPHTCLVNNPSEKEMQDMISKAQVNVLPSFTHSGIKIKLVNSLFNGRHCVANHATVEGSGLEELCHLAVTPADFKERLAELFDTPLSAEDTAKRAAILPNIFNNQANAQRMIGWIWGSV